MPKVVFIKAFYGLALSLSGVALLSCSAQTETIFWDASSGKPRPKILDSAEFKKTDRTVAAAGRKVQKSKQTQGELPVLGGYLKEIYDDQGNLLRVLGRRVDIDPAFTPKSLSELQARTSEVLAAGKTRSIEVSRAQEILDTQWVLQARPDGTAEAQLKVDMVHQDAAIEIRLNPHGQVVGRRVLSSHLDAGVARVFPFGPLRSSLKDEPIMDLMGNGRLQSKNITVTSKSTDQVFSPDLVFRYEPGDLRFDQVQVYYQIDRFLRHYRTAHQLQLPFAINATIHVGFPERKNVAFYYDGQIRLGSGDGVEYENMPRDPSIVMHEAAHAITEAFADLENEGEAGAINEGFSDFFAANVLDSPKMAEASYLKGPYKRTISNDRTTNDLKGSRYEDSLVISGTLWQLRDEIGQEASSDFALKVLGFLPRNASIADLKEAFSTASESIAQKDKIRTALASRGWL